MRRLFGVMEQHWGAPPPGEPESDTAEEAVEDAYQAPTEDIPGAPDATTDLDPALATSEPTPETSKTPSGTPETTTPAPGAVLTPEELSLDTAAPVVEEVEMAQDSPVLVSPEVPSQLASPDEERLKLLRPDKMLVA